MCHVHLTCYRDINNGVYRAGFATKQEAYDKAVREVFAALDRVEDILSRQRYLTGSALTEADVRLYTTLVRFDSVYVGHFKVSIKFCLQYGQECKWPCMYMYSNTPVYIIGRMPLQLVPWDLQLINR